MRRGFARLQGLAYITWHARHLLYHILLGVAWMWIIRDQLSVYSPQLLLLSITGSVFPDVEHLVFFLFSGKRDPYSVQIKKYVWHRDWRVLATFIERGHKYNTRLSYHNIYTIVLCVVIGFIFLVFRGYPYFVFTGAMVIHYVFDMMDDIALLGYTNSNWFRWGGARTREKKVFWKKLDRSIDR
jgi:hypothetical protein